MTLLKSILFALIGLGCSCVASRATQVYYFANVIGSSIQFNGSLSSFQFNPAVGSGNEWDITGESGQPSGSVLGFVGTFTGGPWTYGAITTTDGGLVQSANINPGPATLSI